MLALGLLAGGMAASTSSAAERVFTNKGQFRIPYQLDTEEIKRLGATEIQLHVSTDQGRTWRHVDSVPPVEGKFTFDTAGDGEYAFAVRTLDREGHLHPQGPLTASLQVLVDTTSPALEMELEQIAADQVQARWQANDLHLDEQSLVLERLDAAANGWQPIQVVSAGSGQTSWPLTGAGTIQIRGRIRDAAGNEASAEANLAIGIPENIPATPALPAYRQQMAAAIPLADAAPPPINSIPESSAPLPSINPSVSAFSRSVSNARVTQPTLAQPGQDGPVLSQPAPSLRRVNSTTFQIAYQLDNVGPSGVSRVELYLTEDEGRKWFHYGVDEDGHSPFQVTVPNDGTYGFAIRVHSGVGLVLNPPQPHERPEFSVAVDRQPPRVTLMPIRQGQAATSSQLFIEWTATDDALAEEPVALYVSERASGPWQPLTGWQQNTGRYAWNLGPTVPPQVYVRLEARDAAGNVAQAQTERPLVIDLARPTARFLEVESIR